MPEMSASARSHICNQLFFSYPLRTIPHVIVESLLGLGRRARETGLDLDPAKVSAYFRSRSVENDFTDFTDASKDWYRGVLGASNILRMRLSSLEPVRFLDVGCGRGDLLKWLSSNLSAPLEYLGVDNDGVAIDKCSRRYGKSGRFLALDVQSLDSLLPLRADVIVIMNLLPYVADPLRLLKICRKFSSENDLILAIVDPSPSLYWEREFGGFAIHIRRPDQMREIATIAGWQARELVSIGAGRLGRVSFLQIAYLLICTATL